jgi:hypothetical protein
MMSWLKCCAVMTMLLAAATASGDDFSHEIFDNLLRRHVRDSGVDYAGVRTDKALLADYLAQLAEADIEALTSKAQYAFWINAYNALTWQGVLDTLPQQPAHWVRYQVTTALPENGFWRIVKYRVAKRSLTLDQIEHEILRPTWQDARVHFAVNCASIGCPALRAEAYSALRLEAQLEDQTRRFAADPSKLRIDPASRTIAISPIFDWFRDDFVRDATSIPRFIAGYIADQQLATALTQGEWTVQFLPYDWHLNLMR